MIVEQILKEKGGSVYSVTSDVTVFEALKIMQQKNIGALLIIEKEVLKGIFSERDYARRIALENKSSRDTPIGEIMVTNVFTIKGADTMEFCMELMSAKKIRHLPVVEEGKVLGLISIGDVVESIITYQKTTIDYLESYIKGTKAG